jgi:hypothetical protein
MPLKKITITPGINTQETATENLGGWSFSNLIRFRLGLLEKIGGWFHFSNIATIGTARGLHAFQDLSANQYLAVGSEQRLQIYSAGIVTDITPIRKTSNLSSAFTTTSNSNVVKITDTAHSAQVGDWVNIYTFVSIGGIVLFGFYLITDVIDANNYEITAASVATSGVTDGGTVSEFTTTITSGTVKVTLNNHGYAQGNVYQVQISTTVGGLTFFGAYIVNTVIDANNFDILSSGAASGSTSGFENGGNGRIEYLLSSGFASDMLLTGYGTGTYGSGSYGEAQGSTFVEPLRNWFLDNFGEDLVALPTNGTLYEWSPPVAAGNVATAVANAPLYGAGMFVAMPQAQVVIVGAEVSGTQDPLLVCWCDAGDLTDWTASVTNQAGSYRLSRGSLIVGGLQGPQFGFIWSDIDLWLMNYQGYPLVYGFSIVGEYCGLISPKGAGFANNTAFWMSIKGFFNYSAGGGTQPMECSVWDEIFPILDTNNLDKIFAATNSLFNELAWFFPSTQSSNPTLGEIDSYVKVNYLEGFWDYGSLVRFSWIDESIFGNPLAVDGSGLIQQHEIGYNADTVAMTGVYAQTGYVDISDGTVFLFVNWLIPDFKWRTTQAGTMPSINLTVFTLTYPGDKTPTQFGPFVITPDTQYITIWTRARQMAIKIESDAFDTWWRVGAIRYRGAPAGRI